jgi:hypothetical protein
LELLKGDLNQFKQWCIKISEKLTNPTIDGNQILKETLIPELINKLPTETNPFYIDWDEDIYKEKETKFIFKVQEKEYTVSNCELKIKDIVNDSLEFDLLVDDISYTIKFSLFENNIKYIFPDFKFENSGQNRC